MWVAGSSAKCCATCANWSGPRKVVSNGRSVETSTCGTRGKCYVKNRDTSDCSENSCPKYSKWAALK